MAKDKKAFLINSANRTITEIEVDSWTEIAPAIGCDLFTVIGIQNNDAIYIDDEGLLKPQEHFFLYEGYNQPLAGNGLVLGTNRNGDSVSAKIMLETLRSRITFMTRFEARTWAIENNG